MDEIEIKKIRKRKRKKIVNAFITALIFVLLAVFCFSSYKIVLWYQDNQKNKKDNETAISAANIKEGDTNAMNINPPNNKFDPYWDFIKYPLVSVDFNELLKMNDDTVGWIFMRSSNINYPVVQTNDNNFYLNHGYDKKYNDAGWVYMDYRNNPTDFDKNTIIYAHSRVDRSMFGTLRNAVKKSWFDDKENHVIRFSTPKENTLWMVFSTYTIGAESYYLKTDFKDDNDYKNWINKMKLRSKFNYGVEVDEKDKIMTLSSCYTADGIRVAVHAKLIKSELRN